jgi:hypothetical protein
LQKLGFFVPLALVFFWRSQITAKPKQNFVKNKKPNFGEAKKKKPIFGKKQEAKVWRSQKKNQTFLF